MSIRNFLAAIWPCKPSAEKQVKKLLLQISSVLDDLKIRVAGSLANESALQKKLAQAKIDPDPDSDSLINSLTAALISEQQVTTSLKEIYSELGQKKAEIEQVYEQNLARKRKASTHELLASVYQDFGTDLKLNKYLEKFSSETLKIEYTAESNLIIEATLRKIDQ